MEPGPHRPLRGHPSSSEEGKNLQSALCDFAPGQAGVLSAESSGSQITFAVPLKSRLQGFALKSSPASAAGAAAG